MLLILLIVFVAMCFNTQPPEGGWLTQKPKHYKDSVSTHSRPKAAGSIVMVESIS